MFVRLTRLGLVIASVAMILAGDGIVQADTLFLSSGKSLRIQSLSCDPTACRAVFAGGEAEILASEVLRVEPDEPPDPAEPASTLDRDRSAALLATLGPRSVDQIVFEAARKYALPPSLVRAVARAESSLNPTAISPKGAQGVMQLMPGTARDLGVVNALDPEDNVDAGARFLRQLLEKYQGRVAEALAAYNAGEGAVARHKGVPPYRETRSYIRKVVKDFEKDEPRQTNAGSRGKP